MKYVLAILLPPVAVLMCGKGCGVALLNCLLCVLAWIPGVIHAFIVIAETNAEERNAKLIREINKQQQQQKPG